MEFLEQAKLHQSKRFILYHHSCTSYFKSFKVFKDMNAKTDTNKTNMKFRFIAINGLELADPKFLFVDLYRFVMKGLTGARRKMSYR